MKAAEALGEDVGIRCEKHQVGSIVSNMPSAGRGALRALRAGVLGTAAAALAITGHVGGGGAAPAVPLAAAAAIVTSAVFHRFLSRQHGPVGIATLLTAAQLALHGASVLAADPATGPHGTHALHALPHGETVTAWSAADGRMLAAHVVASALTALVLARGEAVMWGLCALLGRAAVVPRRVLPTVAWSAPGRPLAAQAVPVCFGDVFARVSGRRGPPRPEAAT